MKAARLAVVLVLAGIPLGLFCRLVYLEAYDRNHAPRHKVEAIGAVIPVSVQDRTPVYLTPKQWFWFASPTGTAIQFAVFAVSAAAGAVLNGKWRVFRSPGET